MLNYFVYLNVKVKEPYGNFDMVTCRLSSCNPACTPADNTRKRVWQYIEKERKKTCSFQKMNDSKTCLKRPLKKKTKLVFKTDNCLMQVKSIAECSAILQTFIKLPFAIKTFVLSIFEWPLKTGFTVLRLAMIQLRRCSESVLFRWNMVIKVNMKSYGGCAWMCNLLTKLALSLLATTFVVC